MAEPTKFGDEAFKVLSDLGMNEAQIVALLEAFEILLADGLPEDKIGVLLMGCVRTGRDPVAFAHHMVRLRAALR